MSLKKQGMSVVLAICMAAPLGAAAQQRHDLASENGTERAYIKESVLAERDFPMLSILMQDGPTRELLAHDTALRLATDARWKAVALANRTCDAADLACKSKSLRFAPEEIDATSDSLHRLYVANAPLRKFLHDKLQPASMFTLDTSKSEETILIDGWRHDAQDLNRIIATYCDGVPPRYPAIDAMIYSGNLKTYAALITILLDDLSIQETASPSANPVSQPLFFEPSLHFSLRLLQSNSRDEAGRFWPLASGENAAAVGQVRSTDWSKYPYSVIVIPGAGSEVPNVSISPWGRERVRLGVEAYRTGKAPFLLVSGGFVHPSQTPYCEAIEMKRYLMEIYGIPESAILVDPYARHTTTNLRNASREVLQYGIPIGKPMLVVSDKAQVNYIASTVLLDRSRQELGYLPVALGKRLSPTQIEAVPSIQSLYIDAADPLDP